MARKGRTSTLHGYVVIDKPAGWTSHDVVARARRVLGERRIGHAGTLDPAATGVLPLAVGYATRTIEYLAEADKAYVAEITLGVTTDTADGEGAITMVTPDVNVEKEALVATLNSFLGEQMQTPPMHSAIKIGGQKMYDLARQGKHVELPPRPVDIKRIDLLEWESPVANVFVECSKGTYIRSLARDVGEALGTGAHLSALQRVRTGPFALEDSLSIDCLATRFVDDGWAAISSPPDAVLGHLPRVTLSESDTEDWLLGRAVRAAVEAGITCVYGHDGSWRGIGESDGKQTLRPAKVIPLG